MERRLRSAPLAAVLLGTLLAVLPAHAQGRFGARTPAPARPPASSPGPVWRGGGGPVYGPRLAPAPYVYGWGWGYRGWLWDPWWVEPPPPLVVAYPGVVSAYPEGPYAPPAAVDEDGLPLPNGPPRRTVRRTVVSLSGYGQTVRGKGDAAGAALAVEGEHWGAQLQWNGFALDSLTGIGTDRVDFVHAHLTYALLSSDRGRLRLHLGASGAFAPELSRVGPSVGLSAAVGVLGPLGFEGQVTYTPRPFVEFDAFAGASLAFGPVAVRGGYHWTYVDDRGLVDGVAHTERYEGPFLGLALAL